MADLPSAFWGGYIAVITIVSLIALAWLVANVYFSPREASEPVDQVWDHDLKEGTEPAPIWWFWLIFALLIVSVVYLMLYPGLGRFEGFLDYSQGGELADNQAAYAAAFGEERARIASANVDTLAIDAAVVAGGRHVYQVHCSACHGPDAGGQAALFPNLTDDHWQWGNADAAIEQTIRSGRTAVMPPLGAALGDDGVAELTAYVLALADGTGDDDVHSSARTRFAQFCAACHGPTATGNALLGAPDLTAGVYIYGGTADALAMTIRDGRTGQMPAFGDKLDDTQIRLLMAWLRAE